MNRPNEAPLPDPLAFFLTWPTYGTWLPGDERGWIKNQRGWQNSSRNLATWSRKVLREAPCVLNEEQRKLVEATISDHYRIRGWELLAVNCRSNHVHVVVASAEHPRVVTTQFKSWCTRRLKQLEFERSTAMSDQSVPRRFWWAERGSEQYINDKSGLEAAILYVRDAQDRPHVAD